jgi:hypothetical protein
VYKPRRRRGSIFADKVAKEARRRIRISKKSSKTVAKNRSPRRTKEEIQIAAMARELERHAAWQEKFSSKYGLNKTNLRRVIKAAKASM